MRKIVAVLGVLAALLSSPALADKGMLQITSQPGGGVVTVDGKRKGSTPTEPGYSFIIQLPEGEHVIEVLKPIDANAEHYGKTSVFVADDTVQPVNVTLDKRLTEAGKKAEEAAKKAEEENKRLALEAARKAEEAEKEKKRLALIARFADVPPPRMITVPAGSFMMGGVGDGVRDTQKPVHQVTISKAFEMGITPITFDQWESCVADGGCGGYRPPDEGWGRGTRPVINVSWNDVQGYIKWLNGATGKTHRLPTEAEWEYAARAGTTTNYWWGDNIGKNNAHCYKCGSQWDDYKTAPVGSFTPNPFGLYDMSGNIYQWVEDSWHDSYSGAPTDGSAWTSGSCSTTKRVLRGGSWSSSPSDIRSANRLRDACGERNNTIGFRLARTITP